MTLPTGKAGHQSGKGRGKRKVSKSNLGSKPIMSDFTLLYKASFIRKGSNVFSTREEFEKRIKVFISKWQKTFAFQCCGCQCLFESANELSHHNPRWCQMQVS